MFKRCYEMHPVVTLGQDLKIYGGSCMYPVVEDAIMYVGLDMNTQHKIQQIEKGGGQYMDAYIPNMGVPHDVGKFIDLMETLVESLMLKNVSLHVGCIGGHGRTGMVLSILQRLINDDLNSTSYIRKHYCHKAVESQAQIDFLYRYFGISKVNPQLSKYTIPTHWDTGIANIDK